MKKPNISKWYPVLIYVAIWFLSVCVYFMMSPSDAMGYWILFFWIVLPLAAFLTAYRIGRQKEWGYGLLAVMALFYGVMYMLSRYVTFTIGNRLIGALYGQITLPSPDVVLIVPGLLFFLAGVLLGRKVVNSL